MEKEWKVCSECSKLINVASDKDKYVLLSTRNREEHKMDENSYYHFQCFVDWINERVKEKAINTIQNMQSEAMQQLQETMGVVPVFKIKSKSAKEDIKDKIVNRRLKVYGNTDRPPKIKKRMGRPPKRR